MYRIKFNLLAPIVTFIFVVFSSDATAKNLIVDIKNIKSLNGNLFVEVMDKDFYENDKGEGTRLMRKPVTEQNHRIVFENVEYGEYVVLVFQDLNNNAEPDFSFFSGPVEPVGASNNGEFNFGPPSWQDAMIRKGIGDKTIEIQLFQP